MISLLRSRAPRWAAAVPAAALGLSVAAALGAPAAHAAVLTGSWVTPTANATVSGIVHLDFKTQNTSVTFILPTGEETATVANGDATGTWDTTQTANGQVTINVRETDALTGPSYTPETVTINNPVATPPSQNPFPPVTPAPPAPTFSPGSGATLSPASTVVVSGTGQSDVGYSLDNRDRVDLGVVALPYTVALPGGLGAGQHSFVLFAGNPAVSQATYEINVPNTTPPTLVALTAPSSYFPKKDGYQDSFGVTLTSNESGAAHLYILKGKKTVSKGVVRLASFTSAKVSAGGGLKPGKYSWYLTAVDSFGNVRKTATKSVVADGRSIVKHNVVISAAAADVANHDDSGSCGTSVVSGSSIVLTSQSSCADQNQEIGGTDFFPMLPASAIGATITLAISTTGDIAAVLILDPRTKAIFAGAGLAPGTTVLPNIPGAVLTHPHHELAFAVATLGGRTTTITHIKISYTYVTLK